VENKLNSSSTNPKLVLYFLSLKKKLGLYPLLATPGLLALCINLNLSLRFFTNIFFTPTRYLKTPSRTLSQLADTRKQKLTSTKKYVSHRQKLTAVAKVSKSPSFLSIVSWRRWLLLGRRLRPFDRIMSKWRINWERFTTCRNKAFLETLKGRLVALTKASFKKSTSPNYFNQNTPWGLFSKKPNFYLLRRKKFNSNPKYGCWRILRKLFIRRRQRKIYLKKSFSNRAIYLKVSRHNSYKLLSSRSVVQWSSLSLLPTPSKHQLNYLNVPTKSSGLNEAKSLTQLRWELFTRRFKLTRFPYKTWITRKPRVRKSNVKKKLAGREVNIRHLKLTKLSSRLKSLNFRKKKLSKAQLPLKQVRTQGTIPGYLQLNKWHPYRSLRWTKGLTIATARKLTKKSPVLSIQKNLLLTRPLSYSTFFINFLRPSTLNKLPFFRTFHSSLVLWKKLVLGKRQLFLPPTKLNYTHPNLNLKTSSKGKLKLKAIGKGKLKLKAIGKGKLKLKAIGKGKLGLKATNKGKLKLKAIGKEKLRLKAINKGKLGLKAIGKGRLKLKAISKGKPRLKLRGVKLLSLQGKPRLSRPKSFLRRLIPKASSEVAGNFYRSAVNNELIGSKLGWPSVKLSASFLPLQHKRRTWKISTARRLIPSLLKKNYRRIGKRYKQRPYNFVPYTQLKRSKYLLKRLLPTLDYALTCPLPSYSYLAQRTLLCGTSRQLLSYKIRPFWRPNRKRPLWRSRRRRYIKYFTTNYAKFNLNVRRRSSIGRLPRLHRIKKKIKKFRRKLFVRRTFGYKIQQKSPTVCSKLSRGVIKSFYYKTHLPNFLSVNYPNSLRLKSLGTLLTLGGLSQPLLTYIPNPRYFLESDYSVDFVMPPHGYLYLTPLSHTPILLKWLAVKIKTYSFTSFYDIKEFFLKKYSGGSKTLKSPLFLKRRRVHNKFWSLYQTTSFTEASLQQTPKLTQTPTVRMGLSGHLAPQVDPKIRRIRFKPGYSKIWRTARKALKFSLNLTYLYQHQLTKFLIKFFKFSKIKLMQYHELRIVNILLYSRLAPDLSSAKDFISSNLVFVNGSLCLNQNLILLKNDLFQLVVSLKYYILTKWLLLWVKKKKKRLSKFALKNHLKLNSHRSGLLSEKFPKWILTTLFFKADIPAYLEVDYFTLAGFILYQPFRYLDFNPFTWQFNQYSIYNVYNWKYIT